MSFNFGEIGQRLRAYRMGAGLSTDEVAERLGISRAALYRYEKGDLIKIETLDKVAELLNVSLPSLLGVGAEYFSNAVSYFERMRQVEADAERVVAYYEHIAYRLTSPLYSARLKQMLMEGLSPTEGAHTATKQQIEVVMELLESRRQQAVTQQQSIVCLVGSMQIQRFLRAGAIGTYNLDSATIEERRQHARYEVLHLAGLMDSEPLGIQIGVIPHTTPAQAFQLFRRRDTTLVTVSPYRLGELPNLGLGVATITAAPESIALYEALAAELWGRAHKGSRGAALLRTLVAESDGATQTRPLRGRKPFVSGGKRKRVVRT